MSAMNYSTVWKFHEAPEAFRELSTNGGDEDWIIVLPKSWLEYGLPFWVEVMDSMRDPQVFDHPHGECVVIIGSHA